MKIRAMQLKDMEEVVGMMRVFYDSPAVIHAAPDEILRQDVKDCVGDCPYIEGYIFEENDRILGYNEFVICCGYKQHMIKEWFADYYLHSCDVTFDFTRENKMTVHNNISEPWKVTLVDTGLNTMTGGRIKRVKEHLNGESFFLTYGDGVADINIAELLKFHQEGGRMATLTSVQPMGRFGALDLREDGEITNFKEKKQEDSGWINAGFMVLEPEILDLIEGDATVFEKYPLEEAARRGQLDAYRHNGFWQCMDTMNEKKKLEEMWRSGNAPWKVWE